MEETKETSLVVKNDSFFARLKEFFRMFFGVNGKYTLKGTNENNEQQSEKSNIVTNNLNNLEEQNPEQYLQNVLIELQEAYENGLIKENELTKDQIESLKELYVLQINSLKNNIDADEKIILELKDKIDSKKNY